MNAAIFSGQSPLYETVDIEEIAVLINENARKVSKRVKTAIGTIVPVANMYYSKTREEAIRIVQEIVEKRYKKVFSGGGDGSLVTLINLIKTYVDQKNAQIERLAESIKARVRRYNYPEIGVLKLGTGNGMATALGSRKGTAPLQNILQEGQCKISEYDLIQAEERHFHFSGLGWDAAILNDFLWLRKHLPFSFLRRCLGGLAGYLTSLLLKTIPRELIFRRKAEVEVISTGEAVYAMRVGEIPRKMAVKPGDLIYKGRANVLGVATSPNYGFNLKAYPFAREMPGMMHLRIIRSGVFELIGHARRVWQGLYQSQNYFDFLVSGVQIRLSEPLPFQIAGDAEGLRSEINYSVSPHKVKLLDFTTP